MIVPSDLKIAERAVSSPGLYVLFDMLVKNKFMLAASRGGGG